MNGDTCSTATSSEQHYPDTPGARLEDAGASGPGRADDLRASANAEFAEQLMSAESTSTHSEVKRHRPASASLTLPHPPVGADCSPPDGGPLRTPPSLDAVRVKKQLKNPGPLNFPALRALATKSSGGAPLSANPEHLRGTAPRAPADTVDAAQALLDLMRASPTSSPVSAPPRLMFTPTDGTPRLKRRKRAEEMSPAELLHARETNKRSAKLFRERERARRAEVKGRGEDMQRVNDDLKQEIKSLQARRHELQAALHKTLPASPMLRETLGKINLTK